MYTRILNIWLSFRASFWFVPTLLMSSAAIAAFVMIGVDQSYGQAIVERYPFLEMSPPAARSILSSIVAAMVSTTGVVFSITIVALSLSSSHFGSRLIRTYRNRRTTHFTLGIFVSTSLFCILVLASIRELDGVRFVPVASVVIGILLSVLCLATLVYYIHDMSRAIEAPNVIQRSADDLHEAIKRLFPQSIGQEQEPEQFDDKASVRSSSDLPPDADFSVTCECVGYLQAIENETVMAVATNNNLILHLLIRPGDFLYQGLRVADVYLSKGDQRQENAASTRKKIAKEILDSFIVGPERTHIQDVRHAFDEIVDIAVRALSPGVNDPFTAVNCVDRILAALVLLACRQSPNPHRFDDEGQLRVIAQNVELDECVQGSLCVIHHYAANDPMVRDRVEMALESLRSYCDSPLIQQGCDESAGDRQ